MLGRSLCKFTYREEQESLSVDTSYKLNTLLTFETVNLLMLRPIYSQGHELSRVALDILIPQLLQHASPETLSHALQDGLPPIDDGELEEFGLRFLATTSDSRSYDPEAGLQSNFMWHGFSGPIRVSLDTNTREREKKYPLTESSFINTSLFEGMPLLSIPSAHSAIDSTPCILRYAQFTTA